MSFKLDKELFIVRFLKSTENKIMSKAEIQRLLKIKVDRDKITAIRKITIDTMEPIEFKYFRPKKLNKYSYNYKLWNEICQENPCQEQ